MISSMACRRRCTAFLAEQTRITWRGQNGRKRCGQRANAGRNQRAEDPEGPPNVHTGPAYSDALAKVPGSESRLHAYLGSKCA
jgi:hypothetical protein